MKMLQGSGSTRYGLLEYSSIDQQKVYRVIKTVSECLTIFYNNYSKRHIVVIPFQILSLVLNTRIPLFLPLSKANVGVLFQGVCRSCDQNYSKYCCWVACSRKSRLVKVLVSSSTLFTTSSILRLLALPQSHNWSWEVNISISSTHRWDFGEVIGSQVLRLH